MKMDLLKASLRPDSCMEIAFAFSIIKRKALSCINDKIFYYVRKIRFIVTIMKYFT